MAKNSSQLRSAIQSLNIQAPFQMKSQQPRSDGVPKIQVPHVEAPQNEQMNGFFMLAHRVFSDSAIRDLTGDAFRIYVWMSSLAYRFKTSDGTLRAAIKFISVGTGVSEAAVSRSLESLVKAKLVERIEINYKRGNLWKISPAAFGGNPGAGDEEPGKKVPQTEGPQMDCVAPSERGSSTIELREKVPQFEGEIKITNIQINKDSLSALENAPELRKYFANLKPARKRESEMESFRSLLAEYSLESLSEAFGRIRQKDPHGTKYHSPMTYLGSAIQQVLSGGTMHSAKAKEIVDRSVRDKSDLEITNVEDAAWKLKESLFQESFPLPELEIEAIERMAAGVFLPSARLRRAFAIAKWSETKG